MKTLLDFNSKNDYLEYLIENSSWTEEKVNSANEYLINWLEESEEDFVSVLKEEGLNKYEIQIAILARPHFYTSPLLHLFVVLNTPFFIEYSNLHSDTEISSVKCFDKDLNLIDISDKNINKDMALLF